VFYFSCSSSCTLGHSCGEGHQHPKRWADSCSTHHRGRGENQQTGRLTGPYAETYSTPSCIRLGAVSLARRGLERERSLLYADIAKKCELFFFCLREKKC
jgi:hypothetical protein